MGTKKHADFLSITPYIAIKAALPANKIMHFGGITGQISQDGKDTLASARDRIRPSSFCTQKGEGLQDAVEWLELINPSTPNTTGFLQSMNDYQIIAEFL